MKQPVGNDPAKQALLDTLETCQAKVVAFDLDSTLLDNRPRSAAIMREFGHHIDDALLATAAPEHWNGWSAHLAMCNIGLTSSAARSLIDAHDDFWAERFFTGAYCAHDVAIDGAVAFVNAVSEAAGIVIYLTGRPDAMRNGTRRSLEALGFPVPDNGKAELWTRTSTFSSDDEFKRSAISALSDRAPLVAAFDNEPTHINLYRTLHPDAHCIHLDTDHSGRDVALLEDIVSMKDFTLPSDVLERRNRADLPS